MSRSLVGGRPPKHGRAVQVRAEPSTPKTSSTSCKTLCTCPASGEFNTSTPHHAACSTSGRHQEGVGDGTDGFRQGLRMQLLKGRPGAAPVEILERPRDRAYIADERGVDHPPCGLELAHSDIGGPEVLIVRRARAACVPRRPGRYRPVQ